MQLQGSDSPFPSFKIQPASTILPAQQEATGLPGNDLLTIDNSEDEDDDEVTETHTHYPTPITSGRKQNSTGIPSKYYLFSKSYPKTASRKTIFSAAGFRSQLMIWNI